MMSNRGVLAPVGPNALNSRTSLGPARAMARKPTLGGGSAAPSAGSQIPTSSTGRKSMGGKEDPKLDSRRSMIPTGPSQPRVSLAGSSRPGIGRPSLNARPSMTGTRRPSRSSMAPAGGRESLGRRTSLFGAVGEGAVAKDPRPIKEKPYIIQSVQRLEQFMVEHQYEKPLSQQQLMCPPSKDFFYMLEFCLRLLDPTFAFKDPKKPEEETPVLFKALKYPFGMSARSLSSVGTPHAWPNFLAALHWLVEAISYYETAQEYRLAVFDEDPTTPEAVSHAFFDFVAESYSAFMSFDDRESQLEAEFVRAMLDRNQERIEHTLRLKEHTSQLIAETEKLASQDTRVTILSETLAKAQFDMDALKAELARVQEENAQRAAELNDIRRTGQAQTETSNQLKSELSSIERVLRHQQERGLDADKLRTSTTEVKQAILNTTGRRDEVEQASNVVEMEVAEQFREVERGTSVLNGLLEQTELIKQLGGDIRVQPHHPSVLSMDMKHAVKPVLLAFLEEQRAQHTQNQPILVEMLAKAEQKKEEVNLRRTTLSELKVRHDRENAAFSTFKDSFMHPRKQMDAAIQEVEREIANIALSSKGSLTSRRKDKAELEQKLDSLRQAYENSESALNEQMRQYLEWFINHQDAVTNTLGTLHAELGNQSMSMQ